jgi:peptidoglycan-associated lipoprotein
MNNALRILAVVAGLVLLSACGTMGDSKEGDEGAEGAAGGASGSATDQGSAQSSGMQPGGSAVLKVLDDPANILSNQIIYFDFDSSTVKPESMELLSAHAAFLAENPGLRIRLEGHADERGSREYNLGLGERRARSVERIMVLNGAAASQLEPISFGEERPAALGHDESAWWQNRRVELIYPR